MMIKFFNQIRFKLLETGQTSKPASQTWRYLKYAIGEIFLVVIGILIALQINNWNENKKSKATENYVLNEILSNLNEDALILEEVIQQRERAKLSVANMLSYLQEDRIDKETLERDLVNFLTFERYFPINNAYEILKSKGLQLTNNALTSMISRYYDYEQKKVNLSILDVENAILKILNNNSGISRFIESLVLNESIKMTDYNSPFLKEELYRELVGYKNNNIGTLNKVILFNQLNKNLRAEIESELKN